MELIQLHAKYYPNPVILHAGSSGIPMLIGIAPGPQEAINGIPMIGSQGSTLYRFLRRAGVNWAVRCLLEKWPTRSLKALHDHNNTFHHNRFFYADESQDILTRVELRRVFLVQRARKLALTNAFQFWPLPSVGQGGTYVDPHELDVLDDNNIARLNDEVSQISPGTIFLAGFEALMLVCGYTKERVEQEGWSQRVGEHLRGTPRRDAHRRLCPSEPDIVYLGHPRRWNYNQEAVIRELRNIQ